MELHYGIKQPLRFYEKVEHQNRFRQGGDIKVFKLLMPRNYLLPFQLRRPAGVLPFQSIIAVPTNGDPEIELINDIDNGDLKVYPFDTFDTLVHFGTEELDNDLPTGEYYFEVTDGVNTWYSEVVTVKDFNATDLTTNECVVTKITYWDTCDIADIFYRTQQFGGAQYKNIIYLDIDVGKPEYEFTEEGEEDGEGKFSPDFKRLEKQYLLQGVFPEYLVDALALIPMHVGKTGVVEVLTDRGYTGEVDKLSVSPKWQGDRGLWALTDIIFSTEFVVKSNCCDANDALVSTCLRNYTEVVAEILEGSDDYNNFEYTDASDGTTKVPLANNDRVLIEFLTGEKLIRQYNETAGTYDTIILISFVGDALLDLNKFNGGALGGVYHFWGGSNAVGWIQEPTITFLGEDPVTGRYKVQGITWKGALLQVRINTVGFGSTVVANVVGQDYIDNGALFDIPPLAESVFVRAVGLTCNLGDSEAQDFTGIGYMEIQDDFIVT